MIMRLYMAFLAALLALATLLALPANGDWLHTREGAKIETEGAWEIRGAMVVFTPKGGTLSSMRLSEVDLEASREATEVSTTPPPAPPVAAEEEPREAVLVVTNKDVPQAFPRAAPEAAEEEESAADGDAASAAPVPREALEVVSWRQVEGSGVDGVEIHGTVRNGGRDIIMNLRVRVVLLGEEGEELAAANAFLGAPSLAPTVTTTFRALFPDVYRFESPRFDVRSQSIQVREAEEPGEEEG